jgi:hypothetical protein
VYACELKFEDTRLETFMRRFGEFMDSMNSLNRPPWSLHPGNKNFWTERHVRATATSPDSVSIIITDRNFEGGGNDEDGSPPGNGSYVFIQAKHYQTNTLLVSLYWRNAGDQMINAFAYFAANFYAVDIRPIIEAQSGELDAPLTQSGLPDLSRIKNPATAAAVGKYLLNRHKGVTQEQIADQSSISLATLRRNIPIDYRDQSKVRTPKNKKPAKQKRAQT